MSRTVKIILTLSLLLNITMAGLGIGYAYKVWRYRVPDNAAKEQMSPAARQLVDSTFDRMRGDMKKTFTDMRAARAEMMNVLEAEPFDPAAYDRAWQKLAALQAEMGRTRAESIRGLASEMTPEDRKYLARFMSGPFKGRHRGCRMKETRDRGGPVSSAPATETAPD